VGLRSFAALSGPEKAAQLQELASIVMGIRLFNHHQGKGGTGLPPVSGAAEKLKASEMLERVVKEAEELGDLCKSYSDFVMASKNPQKGENPPSEAEVERMRSDLLYLRQYLCYLLNLQEDLAGSIDRLRRDQKSLGEDLIDLDALVGGRVSVPKEQVYPRFDALARGYRTAWQEVKALEARAKLHGILGELRAQYFPKLSEATRDIMHKITKQDGISPLDDDDGEEPIDLDTIPGPSAGEHIGSGAVRLTVENSAEFLQLPLDFQGFCVHTLVNRNRLLIPGNPTLGVIRYAGRYCVFATERAMAEFCGEPARFFGGIREVCYKHPELIHLLRIHEDFPKSSLHAIVNMSAGSQAVMQADAGTETPLHFQDSYIDKSYEWNEWALRRDALHMADIRRKATSATQTALSHLRRESEAQVYLPKDAATNTTVNRGTNPPRFKRYHAGMRGEPQPMRVVEVKFDL